MLDYIIPVTVGSIVYTGMSIPFLYGISKHTIKIHNINILKNQLKDPATKIWKGPLRSRDYMAKYVITRTMELQDTQEEDDQYLNFNIRRFEGIEIPTNSNEYDDDMHPNFHWWIRWDKKVRDDTDTKLHVISNKKNRMPYTVAYTIQDNYIRYIAVCNGEGNAIYKNINKDFNYSLSIVAINSLPFTLFTIGYAEFLYRVFI